MLRAHLTYILALIRMKLVENWGLRLRKRCTISGSPNPLLLLLDEWKAKLMCIFNLYKHSP
jgi:hypothetical protein